MTPNTIQLKAKPEGWIPIGELARRAGVTKATIHHYVKMGLLPEPIKTNPRRAYYNPEWVQRIRFIKALQEKRFMPLSAIQRVLQDSAEEGLRLVDRTLLEEYGKRQQFTKEELLQRYPVAEEIFNGLSAIGLLRKEGPFCEEDERILQAVYHMRKAGLNEEVGFQVKELCLYVAWMEKLINGEFELFNKAVLGKVSPEEAVRLARVGIRFSSEILRALHERKLMERLEQLSGNIAEKGGKDEQKL